MYDRWIWALNINSDLNLNLTHGLDLSQLHRRHPTEVELHDIPFKALLEEENMKKK